ncbi:MAG: glycosyltransferase family 4 protein, partial [Cyanobacteria bacterium P01_E01_bin.35]
MKITFVLPYAGLSGGIRVVAIYAEKLQQLGHEIFIISQLPQKISLKQQVGSLLKGKGLVHNWKKSASFFDNLNITHKVLKKERPINDADVPDADVVIATWWKTAEWVAQLSASKGQKVYFIQHHEIHDSATQKRAMATYTLPLYKIVIAQWLVELMANKYNDREVALVPNSVDTNQFFALPRSKQSIPTVGMMYSHKSWKGSDISLSAFSLAVNKIKNIRLIAFGQESLSNLKLPPNTEYICHPPQKAIKDIYARCDAWLFGSRYEGFGLPILEAMACRTPVIATPAGAAPELLKNGGGILVKPEEPEDMAKAIIQICNYSDQEWKVLSQAAYAQATPYTGEDAAKLFESALKTAVQ